MRTFSKAMASSWLQRVRALTAACSNGSPSTDARHRWTVVLTAKHPVNTHSLVVELDSIIKHEAVYRRILTRTGDPHAMKQALASVQLAPEVMLRLTLMRECRPDASIVNVLRDLLHITTNDAQEMRLARNATAQLEHITALLETWITLRGIIKQEADPAKPDTTALTFLFERMATMRSLILQAGFDPESMASMLVIAQDDPDMLRELHRMLDELEWLASDLANEIDRRSPELSPLAQGALNGLLVQLHQMK